MKKQIRPPIGSILYDVHENLYYIPNHAGPVKEYVVAAGEVRGYIKGHYVEICLYGKVADKVCTWEVKLSDIGKKAFYSVHEAAIYAKELTEEYERIWSAILEDQPMRRTWEQYL